MSVDLEKSQGCVVFPAMAGYHLGLQNGFFVASTALCSYYSSCWTERIKLKEFEDLFFKSEVLRCNGCEILPSAKKLDGEKLLSDSKKKVRPFLLQSAGPNMTAGTPAPRAFYFLFVF